MKLGQLLICCMANISNIFLAQCLRLETSSRLMIILKLKYNEIWTFLIADIYHFEWPLIHFFQKMKHWNLDIIGY